MRYWNIVRLRHCPLRRDIAGLGASLPTLPPRTAAKMAENPRLSRDRGETRRETDCLLEGTGFELPVPRHPQWSRGSPRSAIRAEETGRIGVRFDSLQEGTGFELLVPRQIGNGFAALSEIGPSAPWAVESAEYLPVSAVRLICHAEIRRACAHRRMRGATRAASTVDSVESLRIDRRVIRRRERRLE